MGHQPFRELTRFFERSSPGFFGNSPTLLPRRTLISEGIALPTKKRNRTKSSSPKRKSNPGTYIVPRGHVSLSVPPFWTLRQTNEDIELEAPSGSTSVIITAFKRNRAFLALDAREYLAHFLRTAPKNGNLKRDKGTRNRATARYKDPEGDHWTVAFIANSSTLLLATCNTSLTQPQREARAGRGILDSIKLLETR